MKEFYQMTSQEAKIAINGSEAPLTEEQVAANRERYGPNALAEGKKKSVAQIFLEQFKDFLGCDPDHRCDRLRDTWGF
ncbi:MAG: cation-transporting P-type ATPase [Clostridia bacterium]